MSRRTRLIPIDPRKALRAACQKGVVSSMENRKRKPRPGATAESLACGAVVCGGRAMAVSA